MFCTTLVLEKCLQPNSCSSIKKVSWIRDTFPKPKLCKTLFLTIKAFIRKFFFWTGHRLLCLIIFKLPYTLVHSRNKPTLHQSTTRLWQVLTIATTRAALYVKVPHKNTPTFLNRNLLTCKEKAWVGYMIFEYVDRYIVLEKQVWKNRDLIYVIVKVS